jgi:uracil-DNA glycosylase
MTRRIAFVGEAWGEAEDACKHAFVGSSGVELLKMAGEAGIITLSREDWECIDSWWRFRDGNYTKLIWRAHAEEVATFNVFNMRPPGNDIEAFCGPKRDDITGLPPFKQGKYFKKEYLHHADQLYADLKAMAPNLVVAFGNTPCWALLRRTEENLHWLCHRSRHIYRCPFL